MISTQILSFLILLGSGTLCAGNLTAAIPSRVCSTSRSVNQSCIFEVYVKLSNVEETRNVTIQLIETVPPHHLVFLQHTQIKGESLIKVETEAAHGIYTLSIYDDCPGQFCRADVTSQVFIDRGLQNIFISPSKFHYEPGDTIKFWISWHENRLVALEEYPMNIALLNPDKQPIYEWNKAIINQEYSAPLSESVQTGTWIIRASANGNIFERSVNVSEKENLAKYLPKTIAEKHYVELKFNSDMRDVYKPGFPFIGKVEAVSSEEQVRVRVRMTDEEATVLYSQDLDLRSGTGQFWIPHVVANTSTVLIEAELVSLGGKTVDSEYILASARLSRWNESDGCYNFLLDYNEEYMVGDEVLFWIMSSCDCDFIRDKVTRVITTSQGVLLPDKAILEDWTLGINIMDRSVTCQLKMKYIMGDEMAPNSNLMVYYIGKNGRVISDVVKVRVALTSFDSPEQLIADDSDMFRVGRDIRVTLHSQDDFDTFCIIGGKQPTAKILGAYDRKPNVYGHGMNFLNDTHKFGDSRNYSEYNVKHFYPIFADQIWYHKCYSKCERTSNFTLPSPPDMGSWKIWGLGITKNGLRVPKPASIYVHSITSVSYKLPATVKVGEIVQVSVDIANNINACIDIQAVMSLSEGAIFLGMDSKNISEKLRLGGYGSTSVVVQIKFTRRGQTDINANVSCYVKEGCVDRGYVFDNSTDALASDRITISKSTMVKGDEKDTSKETAICYIAQRMTSPNGYVPFSNFDSVAASFAMLYYYDAQDFSSQDLSHAKNTLQRNYLHLLRFKNGDGTFGNLRNIGSAKETLIAYSISKKMKEITDISPELVESIGKSLSKFLDANGYFEDYKCKNLYQKLELNAEAMATHFDVGLPQFTRTENIYQYLMKNSEFANSYTSALLSYIQNVRLTRIKKPAYAGMDWNNELVTSDKKKGFKLACATLLANTNANSSRAYRASQDSLQYILKNAYILEDYPEMLSLAVKAIKSNEKLLQSDKEYKMVLKIQSMRECGIEFDKRDNFISFTNLRNRSDLFDLWTNLEDKLLPTRHSPPNSMENRFLLELATCFNSKRETSAVNLEMDLFSGYEILSVNAKHDDLTFGYSKYKGAWFHFEKFPTNEIVCVNYTIASTVLITNLRPMVTRIYPSDNYHEVHEVAYDLTKSLEKLRSTKHENSDTFFENNFGMSQSTSASNARAKSIMNEASPLEGSVRKSDEKLELNVSSTIGSFVNNLTKLDNSKNFGNDKITSTAADNIFQNGSSNNTATIGNVENKVTEKPNSEILKNLSNHREMNEIANNKIDQDQDENKFDVRAENGRIIVTNGDSFVRKSVNPNDIGIHENLIPDKIVEHVLNDKTKPSESFFENGENYSDVEELFRNEKIRKHYMKGMMSHETREKQTTNVTEGYNSIGEPKVPLRSYPENTTFTSQEISRDATKVFNNGAISKKFGIAENETDENQIDDKTDELVPNGKIKRVESFIEKERNQEGEKGKGKKKGEGGKVVENQEGTIEGNADLEAEKSKIGEKTDSHGFENEIKVSTIEDYPKNLTKF